MINNLAVKWADQIVKNGGSEAKREIYIYGAVCLINEIISDFILIVISVFLHKEYAMVLWIVVFNVLRMNLGGYHASTPAKCMTASIVLGVLNLILSPLLINMKWILPIIFIGSALFVFKAAPVLNKNHPLSEDKIRKAKIRGRFLVVLIIALIMIFYYNRVYEVVSVATAALGSVSLLGIIGIQKKEGEVK